jgi:hypothetical protein
MNDRHFYNFSKKLYIKKNYNRHRKIKVKAETVLKKIYFSIKARDFEDIIRELVP